MKAKTQPRRTAGEFLRWLAEKITVGGFCPEVGPDAKDVVEAPAGPHCFLGWGEPPWLDAMDYADHYFITPRAWVALADQLDHRPGTRNPCWHSPRFLHERIGRNSDLAAALCIDAAARLDLED